MINRSQVKAGQAYTRMMLDKSGVIASEEEIESMEVGDFGLSNWPHEGAQIITFVNTERVGFKLICLMPNQTLPEHWHTATEGDALGKEEILRVLNGTLRLGLPGEEGLSDSVIPDGKTDYYTCRSVKNLYAGEQYLLSPGVKHWLQGGEEGVVLYSISSAAHCQLDPFTDPHVVRKVQIIENE